MPTTADQLRAAAYHESGHVVLCFLSGTLIKSVEIGIPRSTTIAAEPSDPDVARLISVAGELAESMAGHGSTAMMSDEDIDGAAHDVDPINRAWSSGAQRDIDQRINRARPIARKLLRDNWRLVEKLANALLAHRHLTRPEIDTLLKG